MTTDLVYKLLTLVVLIPLVGLGLKLFLSSRGSAVLADQDILFFVLSPVGMMTAVVVGAVTLTIMALEMACLMVIGFGASHGLHVRTIDALLLGARTTWAVVRMALHILVRVLLISLPFIAAAALISLALLKEHDINFYLAQRPPVFLLAVGVTLAMLVGMAMLIIPRLLSWAFALPLVQFEGFSPSGALKASSERTKNYKLIVGTILVAWAAAAALLSAVPAAVVATLARWTVPHFAGSMTLLVTVIGGFLLLWGAVSLVAALINESMFALLTVGLYEAYGKSSTAGISNRLISKEDASRSRQRISMKWAVVGLAAAGFLAVIIGQILVDRVRFDDDVIVIAHRGAAGSAPENTLASVSLALDQRTDMVEIDVQENADGEVVVIHDSDLMRVGGNPVRVWDVTSGELREIDIGSWFGPGYSDQRVPTLEQVLALCKGRASVDIELKYYGHNDRLEERVAEIVERLEMEEDIVLMSLDSKIASSMKTLRPDWQVGLLTAKAVGDLTKRDADFLAVHIGIATTPFIRRAHATGKKVYVWTVNDTLNMSRMMSRGVDGIITDYPSLAQSVIEQRAELSSAERLMLGAVYWVGLEPKEPPPGRDID